MMDDRLSQIAAAIEEIMMSDDETAALVVHRDLDGDHDGEDRNCWCAPHLFTRQEIEGVAPEKIEALCLERERVN